MRTLKLVVAYDGSAYHGFQKQKNAVTVQNILEEVLCKLCDVFAKQQRTGKATFETNAEQTGVAKYRVAQDYVCQNKVVVEAVYLLFVLTLTAVQATNLIVTIEFWTGNMA